ncbi:Protein DMP [Dillenia turbinata]|uniref:Protein DMP n=1 Tax=Dillenia turbinata TaxID=194707 RepID=A0AAN8URT1_9MAGN
MADSSLVQHPPPPPRPSSLSPSRLHKTLASAANVANLLPTGTVLAFQALTPPFTNNGQCQLAHKYLTLSLIGFCALLCFFTSFTDSLVGRDGKLYYGIATFKGLYVFNEDIYNEGRNNMKDLSKFKISFIDFVHAFLSLIVFIIFALGESLVQTCFFEKQSGDENYNALVLNLPLGVGVLTSFIFMIFPTTRRGIGFSDFAAPHA